MTRVIDISIVSHLHGHMVKELLSDIEKYCADQVSVILICNIPEAITYNPDEYTFPLRIIHNPQPMGFAANQNAVFQIADKRYFCVLNPDIRLTENPFPSLISSLEDPTIGVVSPLIVNGNGRIEDNARKFLSPLKLFRRVLLPKHIPEYFIDHDCISPDWIAGMFMLFRREIFQELKGFDPAYYLYCEDMDLCARLRQRHYDILLNAKVTARHDARRASHRHWRYLKWHISSLFRFWFRYYGNKYDKKFEKIQEV